LVGVISLAVGYYTKAKAPQGSQGFTLYSTMFTTAKDGQPVKTGSRVRYQRSDGRFKQETTYYNADGTIRKVDVLFGQPNRGVFTIDETRKTSEFVSPLKPSSIIISEEDLRKDHHNTLREEDVMGYRVLVSRLNDDGNGSYTELYHAPALMGFPIKTVNINSGGYKLVIEPTKIVPGDPQAADLNDIRKYPVAYSLYEEKIKALDERGENQIATEMKRILQSAKDSKP
jgi:hypothetical protein